LADAASATAASASLGDASSATAAAPTSSAEALLAVIEGEIERSRRVRTRWLLPFEAGRMGRRFVSGTTELMLKMV
jgi:hypothetical protein